MPALSAPPADWSAGESVVYNKLPPLIKVELEPVGPFFQAVAHRKRHNRTVSEQEAIDAAPTDTQVEDLEDDEPETKELLSLDPKAWKDQDHYAVMGLSKLRYRATDEDIKRAYRKKVLKHHPDKKAAAGGSVTDDNFFKCVQKAYDILTDPVRRLHFDSVDPEFEDSIPGSKLKGDFYEVYGPVFERNARFSKIQPVPMLGDDSSSSDHVREFYDFWFNFDSWRVFNYLDEEDASAAENREDKRYLEKKNQKARAERKREDTQRILRLVEQASKLDPRIKRMRDEELAKKEQEKLNKQREIENAKLAAQKAAEEAALAAKKVEEEAKKKLEEEKQQREEIKKIQKKERKILRQTVKARNYFLQSNVAPDSKEAIDAMAKLEKLVEELSLEDLINLNHAMAESPENEKEIYLSKVLDAQALEQQMMADREAKLQAAKEAEARAKEMRPWVDKEKALLIQAVKLFPGGTRSRWEKITAHVNEHSGLQPRTEKEVIEEANTIKQATGRVQDMELRVEKKPETVTIAEQPSQRFEMPLEGEAKPESKASASEPKPWTKTEMDQLQAALRSVPGNAENRWDKIAALVPSRTKKECMQRYKEIATMLQQKKANK